MFIDQSVQKNSFLPVKSLPSSLHWNSKEYSYIWPNNPDKLRETSEMLVSFQEHFEVSGKKTGALRDPFLNFLEIWKCYSAGNVCTKLRFCLSVRKMVIGANRNECLVQTFPPMSGIYSSNISVKYFASRRLPRRPPPAAHTHTHTHTPFRFLHPVSKGQIEISFSIHRWATVSFIRDGRWFCQRI